MKRMIAALALLLLPMTSIVAMAQQRPLQKLNVGFAFAASSTVALWIAADEGLFQKNGLDVKLIYFRGSAEATQALMGGSIDLIFGSAAAAITAAGRGAPVVTIVTTHLLDYELVTRPDVASAAQLRGKTAGISNHSGGDDFALRRLLPKLGLVPNQDVKFVVLGTPNPYQKAEAVVNGTADSTLVTFEVIETLKKNGKELRSLGGLLANGIKLSVGDIYATRSYLQKEPDKVKSFLRAYVLAIRMAKNDEHLVAETLRKHTDTKDDGILQLIYRKTVVGQFQDVPYPNVEAIVTQRDDVATTGPDLAQLKTMGPETFIDNGPLKSLEAEGFFKTLPPLKTN